MLTLLLLFAGIGSLSGAAIVAVFEMTPTAVTCATSVITGMLVNGPPV